MSLEVNGTEVFSDTQCLSTVHTAIEPSLPKHMNVEWGFDASKVGLVFIAAVVPTFFGANIFSLSGIIH